MSAGVLARMSCVCVCVCVCVNAGEKIQKETCQYVNTLTPASSRTRTALSLNPWQHLETLGLSQLVGEGVRLASDG